MRAGKQSVGKYQQNTRASRQPIPAVQHGFDQMHDEFEGTTFQEKLGLPGNEAQSKANSRAKSTRASKKAKKDDEVLEGPRVQTRSKRTAREMEE